MRVAREQFEAGEKARETLSSGVGKSVGQTASDAPLVDARGNISLFSAPIDDATVRDAKTFSRKDARQEKREANQAALKLREKEWTNAIGMKFSDAAGYGKNGSDPWYALKHARDEARAAAMDEQAVGKDAFGNEDPGRVARDRTRVNASDPMVAVAHPGY